MIGAQFDQDLGRGAIALKYQSEQDVLSTDELVPAPPGFFLSQDDGALSPGR